jgi:HAE1 family hydrophobic/amphiphilic exporter-1/multidrug efflux pump
MAVAGLFSLWLFDQTWNIFSQIGTVMLIGLVTKTESVEFANQLREQGKPKLEAILEASGAIATYSNDKFGHFIGALPIAMSLAASTE